MQVRTIRVHLQSLRRLVVFSQDAIPILIGLCLLQCCLLLVLLGVHGILLALLNFLSE